MYNLLSEALWPGTYNGRYEVHNFNWHASVDIRNSEDYTLEGNYVVGSERIAYLLAGSECDAFTTYNDDTANWAVSNLRGINIFADYILPARDQNCRSFSNFKFWKNEVGSYYQNKDDVLFTNNVYADHKTGMWALLIGPSAENHVFEDKVVNITDSIFFGYLSETNCADDATEGELNAKQSAYKISGPDNIDCRGVTGPAGEKLSGIVFPSCDEGSNKAPAKPCFATQTTNCIGGRTEVSGKIIHYPHYCSITTKPVQLNIAYCLLLPNLPYTSSKQTFLTVYCFFLCSRFNLVSMNCFMGQDF